MIIAWLICFVHHFWMEDSHQVLQQHIRLYRGGLIIGCLLHVAVDDVLVPERLEQLVARF